VACLDRLLRITRVTRSALRNAASIAFLMLTTEVLISETPGEEAAHARPDGGGGMYLGEIRPLLNPGAERAGHDIVGPDAQVQKAGRRPGGWRRRS
jgi:hypothetical protein